MCTVNADVEDDQLIENTNVTTYEENKVSVNEKYIHSKPTM